MPIIQALASEENERENESAACCSSCFKPKLRNPCCNDVMSLQRCMGFQWDSEKDAANQAKHLLGFRQAAEIFRGFRLTREDDRRGYGGRRFVALGACDGEVLRVVFTVRKGILGSSPHGRRTGVTDKPSRLREPLVRFDELGQMPPAEPLSPAFRGLSDKDVERRAEADPDAGTITAGFWDTAEAVEAETKEQITLRLDRDVLRHFRKTGKGYQSRINAVLKSYVRAKQGIG